VPQIVGEVGSLGQDRHFDVTELVEELALW